MKWMTHPGRDLGALLLALAGITGAVAAPANADTALVERGKYLALAGDCVACHTAPGGKPFAGGLAMPTPLGAIVSTNITSSTSHGIGSYTLAQFTDALRRGIRAGGQHLYPAMPYTAYAQVTDDDALALYTYFMHGVAPADTSPPATALPFPFDVRLSMAVWNALFLDDKQFVADAGQGAEWNRGAYLVRGLAHCGACHTPRNALMAEDPSRALGGAEIGPWFAPNVTSDTVAGIGGWTKEELASYMRSGHAAGKAQAAGPMAEAIDNSLRHLDDGDLRAIAGYLKTVPAQSDAQATRPAFAWGTASDELSSVRGVALPSDGDRMNGPQLYDAHCATCHQAQGQGSFDGRLPPLFHNTALGHARANNLVMVMLEGVRHPSDDGGVEVLMPQFSFLSDQQITTLGNYLQKHYGNPQAVISVDQVKALRAGGEASHLALVARAGMVAAIVVLLVLAVTFLRRRRGTAQ